MLKIKSKGFTLIELLIVIAIIGILSSIVLVSLSSARNRAYKASAMSTASGLGTEIITCVDDAGSMQAPTNTTSGGGNLCSATGHSVAWPTLANTGGYCYDFDNATAGCQNLAASIAPATYNAGLQTFYLVSTGNTTITCTWSGTANLTCS